MKRGARFIFDFDDDNELVAVAGGLSPIPPLTTAGELLDVRLLDGT